MSSSLSLARTTTRLLRRIPLRTTTTTTTTISPVQLSSRRPYSSDPNNDPFRPSPSPPRLPADQQAEFERLQRTANTQSGFNASPLPEGFSTPEAEVEAMKRVVAEKGQKNVDEAVAEAVTAASAAESGAGAATTLASSSSSSATNAQQQQQPEEMQENEAMSTPLRKGAPPEFAGDTNPKTGEVGGPKNEPLRWGAGGDYSFNGRVTDF